MSKQPSYPCLICGGTDFRPGPHGRTANGVPPYCTTCGSLERHRIFYDVWKTLQTLYPLNTYTCLQFAQDPSIKSEWFKALAVSIYGGENSMDLQKIPLPDASVDIVVCNHVLEHVADDAAALREMLRIVRPDGFVQISVPLAGKSTVDWGYPDEGQWGHYRVYGIDIVNLFARALPGAYCVTLVGRDACTGKEDVLFLVSHAQVTQATVSVHPRAHFQRLDEGAAFPYDEWANSIYGKPHK